MIMGADIVLETDCSCLVWIVVWEDGTNVSMADVANVLRSVCVSVVVITSDVSCLVVLEMLVAVVTLLVVDMRVRDCSTYADDTALVDVDVAAVVITPVSE